MSASHVDDDTDNVTLVLRKVLKWMDAHDDVPPRVHTKPTPSQKKETALANAYKWVRKHSDAYTEQQRLLQQEIDRRATDPRDLKNIEDIIQHDHNLPRTNPVFDHVFYISDELFSLQGAVSKETHHLLPVLW